MAIRLNAEFYQRPDVVMIARELLGKYLVTAYKGELTAGRIVETEAYRAPEDKASHAYGNRLTARTRVMFEAGGRAYVYLCYGIHHLFNVVSGPEGAAHAVLIRALEPAEGIDLMLQRRGLQRLSPQLSSGPGVLSKALGISSADTGQSLLSPDSLIWLEDRGELLSPEEIIAGPRIGVDYAGESAAWPWRFFVKDSAYVSGKKYRKESPSSSGYLDS